MEKRNKVLDVVSTCSREFIPTVTPTSSIAKLVVDCKLKDFRESLRLLAEVGTKDINEKDSYGLTPLHFAAAFGYKKRLNLLLNNGANPNVNNSLGMTPLFHATGRYPNEEIAKLLIGGGADVRHKTRDGVTALHGAALQGNRDCVQLLLEHGADPAATDDEGITPMDLTKEEAIREMLEDAMKDHENIEDDDVCTVCGFMNYESPVKMKRCAGCKATSYCSKQCQIKFWREMGHKEKCKGEKLCEYCGTGCEEPGVDLKRCSDCKAVHYCSRDCQKKDWKSGHKDECEVFMVGYMGTSPGAPGHTVINLNHHTHRLSRLKAKYESRAAKALGTQRFIVKVQVPIMGVGGAMMVYNEDRSVHFHIPTTNQGYLPLRRKIEKEGVLGGIKAFFWAQRTQKSDGGVKIFYGKLGPYKNW